MTAPTIESLAARVEALEQAVFVSTNPPIAKADLSELANARLMRDLDAIAESLGEPVGAYGRIPAVVTCLVAERDALHGQLVEFAEAIKPWGEHREDESPSAAVLRILVARKDVARQRNAAQQEVANLKAQIAAIESAVAAAKKKNQ